MADMTSHAKKKTRDHLWVLAVVAACCLIKVWPSWVGIGAEADFPDFGKMRTDWTLAVVVEAYWAYAVYAWLAAPAGKSSRLFAIWSAAAVFGLSVVGQSAAQVMDATAVKVFANALPVIVLALIAVLVHLRVKDREEAAEAARILAEADRQAAIERAEADERTALRADLEAIRGELAGKDEAAKAALESLRAQLETAHADLAEALTRKEELAARIAQMTAQKKRAKAAGGSAQAEDLTTEFRALDEMEKDPSLRGPRMGGELARRIGVSGATGRRLHARLTAHGQSAGSAGERSPDAADERSPAEEG